MNPILKYHNARSAAVAVKNELEIQGHKPISARPWNMYNPDHTFWWIIPGTEWPAYRFGKYFFQPDNEFGPEGSLFCGLNVEKGLARTVAEAYPSAKGRRYIIQDDWIWFDFLKSIDSSEFVSTIAQISKASQVPVNLFISAGYVEEPGSFDPYAERFKWDKILFQINEGQLVIENSEIYSTFLKEAALSKNFYELKKSIDDIPNKDWLWLDILLGIFYEKDPSGSGQNFWDAKNLVSNMFSKWEMWFR